MLSKIIRRVRKPVTITRRTSPRKVIFDPPSSSSKSSEKDEDSKNVRRKIVTTRERNLNKRQNTSPKIKLRDNQIEHSNELLKILEKYNFCLDTSALSSGKTYTALYTAQRLRLPNIIYISTGQILEKVRPVLKHYGFSTDHLITFQSLRSTTGRQPKHGLLTRHDPTGLNPKSTYFAATDELKKMVDEGLMVVIDEVQNIKNRSMQFLAVSEIEKLIIESQGRSKIIELSGLPANKVDHFINIMKRFRIITASTLFSDSSRRGKTTGFEELVDFCNHCDPVTTEILLETNKVSKVTVKDVCFTLYEKIVQYHISHSMKKPPAAEGIKVDIKNGYYNLSIEDQKILSSGIGMLSGASGIDSVTKKINTKNTSWGIVTTALRCIEITKVNMMIRIAKEVLESNPKAKVVIGLNYTKTLDLLGEHLSDYGVISLLSSIKFDERAELIEDFNAPNTDYRVLLGNIGIINSGIDLDDRDGSYPRYAFGSASYYFIECHQFSWRFLRGIDTKSNSFVRFVFGKTNNAQENSILDALARSSDLCTKTLEKQVDAGVKFPGEYGEDVEPDNSEPIPPGPCNIRQILKELNIDVNAKIPAPSKRRINKIKPRLEVSPEEIKVLQENHEMDNKYIGTKVKPSKSVTILPDF